MAFKGFLISCANSAVNSPNVDRVFDLRTSSENLFLSLTSSMMVTICVTFPRKSLIADVLVSTQASLDRKSTRLNSSHSQISYAVFCLKKNRLMASSLMHAITHETAAQLASSLTTL